MVHRTGVLALYLVAASICTFELAPPVLAEPARYTMKDVGGFAGYGANAYRVNDHGQVIGASRVNGDTYHAFMYDGTMHDLGTLGAHDSYAYGINNSGRIVGGTYNYGPRKGFLYDGTIHDMTPFTSVNGINSVGQFVGQAPGTSGYGHAFRFDGAMHDLGTLGGSDSSAMSISDNGMIVGWSRASVNGYPHAFLYGGTMHDLGTLGAADSYAQDVNNAGRVVGNSTATDGNVHAFLYDGTMHDLGPGYAYGINEVGVVVGQSWTGAFPFDGTKTWNLNDLVAPGSGWDLLVAQDINNVGQLVVRGTNTAGDWHSFLLTPVPEPSSLLALLCGVGGLGGLVVRGKRCTE